MLRSTPHRSASPQHSSRPLLLGLVTVVGLLSACGSSAGDTSAEPSQVTSSASQPGAPSPSPDGTGSVGGSGGAGGASGAGAALALTVTSLGKIVTDDTGMAVYVFDKDTQGTTTSACTAGCLGLWPPVELSGSLPAASAAPGVSGTLATIKAPDGGRQLTLNGWPLYRYAGDQAVGDVSGQGVEGIWWVVGADGSKITSSGASSSPTTGPGRGSY